MQKSYFNNHVRQKITFHVRSTSCWLCFLVAEWLELLTLDRRVLGSTPVGGSNLLNSADVTEIQLKFSFISFVSQGEDEWINRIYHLSSIFHADREIPPRGKWIIPETRFNKFPPLSVDPRIRIS